MTLIEKWKKSVDNDGAFGALFTDFSKAFDCLSHELLIAKLDAYGFDKNALKLVNSYLSNRKQRVKINNKYSSWSEILFGVPQGSFSNYHINSVFHCPFFYFPYLLHIPSVKTNHAKSGCSSSQSGSHQTLGGSL